MTEKKPTAAAVAARVPDWEAIRNDYQESMDSQRIIAERHGVTPGQLSSRISRHSWYRLGKIKDDGAVMREAVIDLMNDTRRAVKRSLARGNRLIERAEREGASTEMLLAQHERNVASVSYLVRAADHFAKMAESMGVMSATSPSTETADDIRARLEGRLVAMAEKIRVAGYPLPHVAGGPEGD